MDLQLDLDNYPIWFEPFWHTVWFKSVFGLVALGLVIFVAAFFYNKYGKKNKEFWQLALIELSEIESSKEDCKQLYFKLTNVLKNYFSKRFGINFNVKTDDELILKINEIPLLDLFNKDIEKIFITSKLVKFARRDISNLHADIYLSKRIIESTIPIKEK
jgi:hypothetical protein